MIQEKRILNYINLENIYPRQDQFGSQRNSSINHEVIELVDKISDTTENNDHTIGINNCLKVELYLARRKKFVKCNVDERKYLYNVESRKHLFLVPSFITSFTNKLIYQLIQQNIIYFISCTVIFKDCNFQGVLI